MTVVANPPLPSVSVTVNVIHTAVAPVGITSALADVATDIVAIVERRRLDHSSRT